MKVDGTNSEDHKESQPDEKADSLLSKNPGQKPTYALDLDAISNEKPETKSNKDFFNPKNRVDFTLSREENRKRYISAGQIGDLYKLPEKERKRIFNENLTPEQKTETEQFLKTTTKLLENFKMPAIPSFTPSLENIKFTPPPNHAAEQVALLRQLVATNSQKTDPKLITPSYDASTPQLIFCNTIINIASGSDKEIICKKLFRAGKPVKNPVEKGDLYEALGVLGQSKEVMRKKVYSAKDALNTLVGKKTGVDDLFVIVDKKLWFNQNYL